jgi:hypothetical protein
MFDALVILLAVAGPATPAADPLAPARAGKIQCIAPNKPKKSCIGLGTYTVRPDGSFDAVMNVIVSPTPRITMETRSTGKVEGDAVCSTVLKQEYAEAKITIDGAPAEEATAQAIRGQIVGAVAPLEGKKACSREVPEGELSRVDVTVDGTARPELTQRVIWVRPDEGYTLGM